MKKGKEEKKKKNKWTKSEENKTWLGNETMERAKVRQASSVTAHTRGTPPPLISLPRCDRAPPSLPSPASPGHPGSFDELLFHRISTPAGKSSPVEPAPSLLFGPGKAFQKRRVSSPAPVTIVCPSGDIAKYKTLMWMKAGRRNGDRAGRVRPREATRSSPGIDKIGMWIHHFDS